MKIRLNWTDQNSSEDGHNIYRSTSPIDPNSLPAPLDTIGPNIEFYDDETVIEGTIYYYRVSAFLGSSIESLSQEVKLIAFNPELLFDSSTEGAWYDPSDLSTLFQDSAGTIPVTSDGDPVGLMLDKSGNGNHASQAISSARPIYRTDGTYHWLDCDGVDDHFKLSGMVLRFEQTVAIIGSRSDSNVFSEGQYFGWRPNGVERFYAFSKGIAKNIAIQLDANTGIDIVRSFRWDDPGFSLEFDRVVHVSDSDSITGDIEIRSFLGGSGGDDIDSVTNFFKGRFYGGVIAVRAVDDSAVSYTEEYIAEKSGVTL